MSEPATSCPLCAKIVNTATYPTHLNSHSPYNDKVKQDVNEVITSTGIPNPLQSK